MGFFFNGGGKEVQYVGSRERQSVAGGLVDGRGWYGFLDFRLGSLG